MDMLDGAISSYEQALKLQPDATGTRVSLAILLQQEGDLEESLKELQSALEIDADTEHTPAIFASIASLHGEAGNLEAAADTYRDAVNKFPESPQYHFNLATMLAMNNDWDGAVKHYRNSVSLDPSNEETHDDLIAALQNLGDTATVEEARKAKALAISKTSPEQNHDQANECSSGKLTDSGNNEKVVEENKKLVKTKRKKPAADERERKQELKQTDHKQRKQQKKKKKAS